MLILFSYMFCCFLIPILPGFGENIVKASFASDILSLKIESEMGKRLEDIAG